MADTIRVRLVPKSRSGASLLNHFNLLSASTVEDFAPDPSKVREAIKMASELGIRAEETPLKGITAHVSKSEFKRVFATELSQTTTATEANNKGEVVTTKKFLAPKEEVNVPDSMKGFIDFAYVPTPPTYLAQDSVPPITSTYHLRVEDVARILKAYQCHRQNWTGRGIKIAMVDSGFGTHPFFNQYAFNITRISASSNVNPEDDSSGHGTGECANALVIAPDSNLIGIKQNDSAAESLEVAMGQQPNIMTNSWGWSADTQSLDDLRVTNPNFFNEVRDIERIVKDAIANNVTVIFSAGNGHFAFPGSLPDVISAGGVTVGAANEMSASSYASSFVSQFYPDRNVPDFCGIVGESGSAPMKGHIMLPVPSGSALEGDNLLGVNKKRGWGVFSGTSAAAPQIAGVVALMLSVNPHLTPAQVKGILAATATDVTTGATAQGDTAVLGRDLATGNGLVNALGACLRTQQLLGG